MKIEKKGKTAEIEIIGDLTDKRSHEFVKAMNDLIAGDVKKFNFDLKSVTLIDSYAFSNLIVLCDIADIEITFRNVNPAVMNLFDIIKLNKQILIE